MKFDLRESWFASVDKRNSILCAGIDPPEYIMGRSEKGSGLPAGINKRDWVLRYLGAVEPYIAAFKPNVRYVEDNALLCELGMFAQDKGLVFIQDSKEADIGKTNDAGIFRAALRGAHAVTLAPFAGNMKEAIEQGIDRNIGLITMGLMSSPDYAKIKNMWVDVSDDVACYETKDIKQIDGVPHTRFYIKQTRDANRFGLAGIVLGAPSTANHITPEEIGRVKFYSGDLSLKLVPGIGTQGGEVTSLATSFNPTELIANVGRALMFPTGTYSETDDWVGAAQTYRNMLNELRKRAC
ncbi:MAG: orotidine 5'-phosphate decarboxylase [Candidatus Levybacteria bacterium]|nr:orotidine 5'-phosphate decarboxylase [Candidatus Levybacteria bacterium]